VTQLILSTFLDELVVDFSEYNYTNEGVLVVRSDDPEESQ